MRAPYDVAIVGGGFTGLAAAFDLARGGQRVVVLEKDAAVGGLAGSFEVAGESLEKFYHHWFTNDAHVIDLVRDLGTQDRILHRPTRTGMYFGQSFFRLSSPKDLLKFTPLSFPDRIRLGLLALKARKVEDWKELERLTAEEWLVSMGGETVFRKIWEPMLKGKFGPYANDVSAVWFWNKLKLRGGSRGKKGEEVLAYYRGGFASLAESAARAIEAAGGEVRTNAPALDLIVEDGAVRGVQTADGPVFARRVLATQPLPLFADLVEPYVSEAYDESLRRIRFLANVCLVLELDRSLSDTYWLNVADPDFPYVGIIEHTNFEPKETYGGRHIVYLSKYLPESEPLFQMDDEQVLRHSIPHIQRMFPAFEASWVLRSHVWRARYSQPIVVKEYGRLIPPSETPLEGLYLCTMAQVYPEDRGTNYAIREGRSIARRLLALDEGRAFQPAKIDGSGPESPEPTVPASAQRPPTNAPKTGDEKHASGIQRSWRLRIRRAVGVAAGLSVIGLAIGWAWAAIKVGAYLSAPSGPNYVPIAEISQPFLDATVAMEDGNFYRHRGFDWAAIRRAIEIDLRSGRIRQGGSTITQQLAKNAFLGEERTPWRKGLEAFLTFELERRLGKRSILERYVNVVDYGMGNRGVGSATRWYFGKKPSAMGLAESAMLVGTVPRPFKDSISVPRFEKVRTTCLSRIAYFFPDSYRVQDLIDAETVSVRSLLSGEIRKEAGKG